MRSHKQIDRDFRAVAPPAPTKAAIFGCEAPPRLIYPSDHRRAARAATLETLRDRVRAELEKERTP